MRKIRPYVKELLNIIVCVYMVLIIAVMPFHYTMGYGRIGSDKYDFFYSVTTKAGGVFLVVWGIYVVLWLAEVLNGSAFQSGNRHKLFASAKADLSRTDIFALIYGAALVFSYLHTDYKEMTDLGSAWNGATGWYMGFTTQIMFLGIYFAVSRFWRTTKVMPALWLPVTFIVFALGYLNRFSVYPIEMEYANSAFISTIGNINWYCGYTVAVFFVLLYYWWSSAEKNKWVNGALLAVCATGFGTVVTQGSNSGHLTLAVMCVVFYLLSIKDGRKMQRFWLLVTIMGGSLTATALFRLIFPGKFSSEDAVTKLLTYSVVPVILLAAGLVMWKLVGIWNQKGAYPVNIFMKIGKVGVITALAGFVLVMILIVVNTLHPGSIGKLSELGLFTFDARWGSSRGATYMAGMQVWLDQDFVGKLLGVGPDSMAMYIHEGSNPELLAMVEERFGGNILTNAHCEWLTILADAGVLGLIGFGGMIVSAVVRYIKAGKSDALIAACGMGILAYTINNVFSFQQAMGTTTMFLILGMGEAFIRAGKEKRIKTGEYHGTKSNQLQKKHRKSKKHLT